MKIPTAEKKPEPMKINFQFVPNTIEGHPHRSLPHTKPRRDLRNRKRIPITTQKKVAFFPGEANQKIVDGLNKLFFLQFLLYAVGAGYTFTQFFQHKLHLSVAALMGVRVTESVKGQISGYLSQIGG